jgi:hypothetical protein
MCSDEFHQYTPKWIGDVHHQPIFVSAEVENSAVISDKVYGGTEASFDIGWTAPFSLGDHGKPSAERTLSLGVTLPELF